MFKLSLTKTAALLLAIMVPIRLEAEQAISRVTGAQDDVRPAQPLIAPLAPLARLVGHCWSATLDRQGGAEDVHCYNVSMNGSVVSDKHVVSQDPLYCGVTLYHAVPIPTGDPARRQGSVQSSDTRPAIEIRFRYYNILGGSSDGVAIPRGRNTLAFPDEVYQGEDGEQRKFRTQLNFIGDDTYEIRTLEQQSRTWREVRKVSYYKLPGGAGEPEGYDRCR